MIYKNIKTKKFKKWKRKILYLFLNEGADFRESLNPLRSIISVAPSILMSILDAEAVITAEEDCTSGKLL